MLVFYKNKKEFRICYTKNQNWKSTAAGTLLKNYCRAQNSTRTNEKCR